MLPKTNRITKKADFDRVFKKGAGFKQGFLFLKTTAGALGKSRFAFIVGKKVSGKATARNRIRRQLQKLMSDRIKGIKTAVDGVLVVLPGFDAKDFLRMKTDFQKLLEKAKIF